MCGARFRACDINKDVIECFYARARCDESRGVIVPRFARFRALPDALRRDIPARVRELRVWIGPGVGDGATDRGGGDRSGLGRPTARALVGEFFQYAHANWDDFRREDGQARDHAELHRGCDVELIKDRASV